MKTSKSKCKWDLTSHSWMNVLRAKTHLESKLNFLMSKANRRWVTYLSLTCATSILKSFWTLWYEITNTFKTKLILYRASFETCTTYLKYQTYEMRSTETFWKMLDNLSCREVEFSMRQCFDKLWYVACKPTTIPAEKMRIFLKPIKTPPIWTILKTQPR